MKSKNYLAEIKELDVAALKTRSVELRAELLKGRFRKVSGQLKQSHLAGQIRKQIAQVETVIRQKVK